MILSYCRSWITAEPSFKILNWWDGWKFHSVGSACANTLALLALIARHRSRQTARIQFLRKEWIGHPFTFLMQPMTKSKKHHHQNKTKTSTIWAWQQREKHSLGAEIAKVSVLRRRYHPLESSKAFCALWTLCSYMGGSRQVALVC